MSNNRKYLMIVMAGDNSVHENNISQDRNFDLWVVYYGNDKAVAERYKNNSDRFWQEKGMKVGLIRKILINRMLFEENFDFKKYEYIFLPDDDIEFSTGVVGVNNFLEECSKTNAEFVQPAIENDNSTYDAAKQIKDIYCHEVTWVEIMMPAYRSDIFTSAFLPSIHLMDFWDSGWGIEITTRQLAQAQISRNPRSLVMDCCPAIHTRPPGTNKAIHLRGNFEHFLIPQSAWLAKMEVIKIFRKINDLTTVNIEKQPIDNFINEDKKDNTINIYMLLFKLNGYKRRILDKIKRLSRK